MLCEWLETKQQFWLLWSFDDSWIQFNSTSCYWKVCVQHDSWQISGLPDTDLSFDWHHWKLENFPKTRKFSRFGAEGTAWQRNVQLHSSSSKVTTADSRRGNFSILISFLSLKFEIFKWQFGDENWLNWVCEIPWNQIHVSDAFTFISNQLEV